jgi:hypothetical protein
MYEGHSTDGGMVAFVQLIAFGELAFSKYGHRARLPSQASWLNISIKLVDP